MKMDSDTSQTNGLPYPYVIALAAVFVVQYQRCSSQVVTIARLAAYDRVQLSDRYCNVSKDHTACKHEKILPSPTTPEEQDYFPSACGSVPLGAKMQLLQEEIEAILEAHNKIRSRVARGQEKGLPAAANMNHMMWSFEAAAIAQRWAQQCQTGRDSGEKSTVLREYFWESLPQPASIPNGQNTYSFGSKPFNADEAVNSWFADIQSLAEKEIDAYSGAKEDSKDSSQLIWAATSYVGCGYMEVGGILVCNYKPAGNVVGEPIYQKGEPCSKCSHWGCMTDHGLCKLLPDASSFAAAADESVAQPELR